MEQDYFAQEIGNSTPDQDFYASEIAAPSLGASIKGIIPGAEEAAHLLVNPLSGSKMRDMFMNAATPPISAQPTKAPYDSNVTAASNPIRRAVGIAGAGAAGAAGQYMDTLTSPLALAAATPNLLKSTATQVGKFGDSLAGKKFDTLNEGRQALDAIRAKDTELGQKVGAFYKSPEGVTTSMGNTPVPATQFQEAINKLPIPLQNSLKMAMKNGQFQIASDGSIASNVRNAHDIRMLINKTIADPYFHNMENASQNVGYAKTVSDKLGSLINKSAPTVKLVNAPFANYQDISEPILSRIMDSKSGDVNMNPLRQLASGKMEDRLQQNYHELQQQVPQLAGVNNTLRKEALYKNLRGFAGSAFKKGAELMGLKLTFPEGSSGGSGETPI